MGVVSLSGNQILFDGEPFYYQGVSFFNALYNPNFNKNDENRRYWLKHFKSWGITALRIWGDWRTTNGWIDEGPSDSLWSYPSNEGRNVLYEPDGEMNEEPLKRLKRLLTIARASSVLFTNKSSSTSAH